MSNTMRMLKPKSLRTPEELEELDRIIREETKTNAPVVPVKIRHGGIIEPLTRSKRLKALELRKSAELKKVKKRITEAKNLFEIEPERITPVTNLYQDLEIDSIDAIDLIDHIKRETGRKLKADDFRNVRTVEDVVQAVLRIDAE